MTFCGGRLFRKFFGSKERPGAHRALEGFEILGQGHRHRPNADWPHAAQQSRHLHRHVQRTSATCSRACRPREIRGYESGRFSFNVKGGRCEKCQGDGLIKIEMHFLPPVYVTCEACNGRRYNRETLEITYKGKNIADVLDMTVDEAVTSSAPCRRSTSRC